VPERRILKKVLGDLDSRDMIFVPVYPLFTCLSGVMRWGSSEAKESRTVTGPGASRGRGLRQGVDGSSNNH
jgi:hypothetical protein